MKKYRAVLIGCGRMGATIDDEVAGDLPYSHAAGYTAVDEIDLVAVSDVFAEKVEAIQKRYNVPNSYTDYHKMIIDEKPDIVSIATRPATHAEMTIFAAENGVAGIYCEKPLACSMIEVDQMIEACEKNGVKFNYGINRRYQLLYRKMRELIDDGTIGDLRCVVCHCGSSSAQWGHTHMADMMLFLAGDGEIDHVHASITAKSSDWNGDTLNIDPGIPMAFAKFKNGVLGYNVASHGYEFEAIGTKGKLRTIDNGKGLILRLSDQKPTFIEGIEFSFGTAECVKDLIRAIRTDTPTQSGIRISARSQEMIFAFVESGRHDGKRIELPLKNRDLYVGRKDW